MIALEKQHLARVEPAADHGVVAQLQDASKSYGEIRALGAWAFAAMRGNSMASQKFFGWTLTIVGLALLASFGNLALLVALVPISLMLGYGALRFARSHNGLTPTLKRGSLDTE